MSVHVLHINVTLYGCNEENDGSNAIIKNVIFGLANAQKTIVVQLSCKTCMDILNSPSTIMCFVNNCN